MVIRQVAFLFSHYYHSNSLYSYFCLLPFPPSSITHLSSLSYFSSSSLFLLFTELQNCRQLEFGRNESLEAIWSNALLQPVAQDCMQMAFKYPLREHHELPGQPVPMLNYSHSEECDSRCSEVTFHVSVCAHHL